MNLTVQSFQCSTCFAISVSPVAPVEPGKFDLVYQNPDGTERVEYAVSRESRVNLTL